MSGKNTPRTKQWNLEKDPTMGRQAAHVSTASWTWYTISQKVGPRLRQNSYSTISKFIFKKIMGEQLYIANIFPNEISRIEVEFDISKSSNKCGGILVILGEGYKQFLRLFNPIPKSKPKTQ